MISTLLTYVEMKMTMVFFTFIKERYTDSMIFFTRQNQWILLELFLLYCRYLTYINYLDSNSTETH